MRRFVAAPFEGILEKSLVEPGEVVKQDQILALMDAREIRLAISETTAELRRSEVKRNVQLAKQDQGAAQMAELEKQRLDLKLELLPVEEQKIGNQESHSRDGLARRSKKGRRDAGHDRPKSF